MEFWLCAIGLQEESWLRPGGMERWICLDWSMNVKMQGFEAKMVLLDIGQSLVKVKNSNGRYQKKAESKGWVAGPLGWFCR